MRAIVAIGVVVALAGVARGQDAEPGPGTGTGTAAGTGTDYGEEIEDLQSEVEILREDLDFVDDRVKKLLPIKGRLSGYLDFGFFRVAGDGTGFRSDLDHSVFPEFDGVPGSWVFMGDPLATAVNSRGEPAETGESRALTYDQIDNGGVSSFIVNAVNVNIFTGIGDDTTLTLMFDIVPRSRDQSNPDGLFFGDYVDAKLAYVEYLAPTESFDLSLFAGKFDSVMGREYRIQESPDRITVTPSLICRYLCGHPLGVKARASFFGKSLVLNASITNGSHFWEGFNFADEIDKNELPTAGARLSYRFPWLDHLEIGVSGAYGAQDAQTETDVRQWHTGADLFVIAGDFELTVEYVKGKAEGEDDPAEPLACAIAPCLDYQGAYGLAAYRVTNTFIPYARVDWRDATHLAGASFAYISNLWRVTSGLRAEIGTNLIIKGEYTVNRELGRVPAFPNDVLTTSLIVKY